MAGSVGKRFRIGLVTIAGVMLLVWLVASYLLGPRVTTRVLAATSLVRTIVASGRVVTPLRVDVSSQISGAVRAVPVREGQSVVAGQALIEIAPQLIEIRRTIDGLFAIIVLLLIIVGSATPLRIIERKFQANSF